MMQLSLALPVIIAALFGLVVSGVYYAIIGFTVRAWLAGAWVLACLCYIVLFGAIKL